MIQLTQRPPRFVRNLPAEARARRLRRQNQPRRDAGILQPPRKVGSKIIFAARVARTGGMTYVNGDGRAHVETRDPDELRRIVGQLVGRPVVVDHPAEGMVGPTTKIAGHVVNAYYEAGDPAHAVCDLEISDPEALRAIQQDGIREISLGYFCDLDGPRQTNTKVDHVAVVPQGRCGPSCSLRADAHASCSCGCGGACTHRKDQNMQNSSYSAANADPQDLAHKSLSGANAAPWTWSPLPADADATEIKSRMANLGACRFPSPAEADNAKRELLAAARRLGFGTLARMYETQWASGQIAADPDTDEAAAQERARQRSAVAYLGTGDIR